MFNDNKSNINIKEGFLLQITKTPKLLHRTNYILVC